MAIHKASFNNIEIIIQAPKNHPWPAHLNSVQSVLTTIIEERMSGIQTNYFAFGLCHRKDIANWRSLEPWKKSQCEDN